MKDNKTKWLEFDKDSGCYINKAKGKETEDNISIYSNMLSQKEIEKITKELMLKHKL